MAAVGLGGISAAHAFSAHVAADPAPCVSDVAIDNATALVYSSEAPLAPEKGMRDAQAVWCRVPPRPARGVLIYLHGYNGYVTVDANGRSRVPDWAAGDEAARAGASSKQAAPLVYGLDRLGVQPTGKGPIVLVPEVGTLAKGSFWAKGPAGQYADPARLGLLVADCASHLACLHKRDGAPYLDQDFLKQGGSPKPGQPAQPALDRVYLCGHSAQVCCWRKPRQRH